MKKRTVLLTILDGWGYGDSCPANAITSANTPTFDNLKEKYPNTQIYAHGRYVGLPDGQMGNSEVGHLNIGAGRVVYQDLTRINLAIDDKSFFDNPELLKAAEHAQKNNSSIHFVGLVSDGGVHSSIGHLFACIDFAKEQGLKKVYVHAFLDGRDTPPRSADTYLAQVEEKLKQEGFPQIASITGRYYAMDRDKRWDRTEKAYNCLLLGEGKTAQNSAEAIQNSYEKDDLGDEFVLPCVTNSDKGSRIQDDDSVVFINFRPDRSRQITQAINDPGFDGFDRKKALKNIYFVCMTQYDETFDVAVAYPPESLTGILGEVLDKNNIKEFRTAETEKYAHITFFFNGGVEKAYDSETRCLVPSPKVATYDLQPEMSAPEVADKVVEALRSQEYGFILVNFANPDMVGHTGIFDAAVKAVETIDNCLDKIVNAVKEVNAVMLLTADHGNAECMQDPETHKPFTAHTTNPVPFFVINLNEPIELREGGCLADIAPTVLKLFDIEKPAEMTGNSLIVKKPALTP